MDSPLEPRHPNPQGSNPDPTLTEEQQLVSELLGGVAWRTVVDTVIVPRVAELRKILLTKYDISEVERTDTLARMAEYRIILDRLYANTEAGELPVPLQKIFI